jgi:hypothetical protein
MTQTSLRARLLNSVVALALVAAAVLFARNSGTSEEVAPAAPAPSSEETSPANYADASVVREVDRPLPHWELAWGPDNSIDKVRWFPLSNNYHGLTFVAVNQTGMHRSGERGPSVRAAYTNAPGMFGAKCEAAGSIDDEPDDKKELLALRAEPGRVVAPEEKVRFVCFQYMGDVPEKKDLPQGKLRIDPQTFTLLSY